MKSMKVYVVVGLVVSGVLAFGCTDKAEPDFKVCTQLAADGQYGAAKTACEKAVASDPSSKSGSAAKKKLEEMQPALAKLAKEEEEKAKAAEAARQVAERARWKSMPTTLNKKIRDQAMWDIGRGTATPVMAVIEKEIGAPVVSYEGAYGSIHHHAWGGRPASTSTDDIHAVPFSVSTLRSLTCGDYTSSMVEFYSYGTRLQPEN